VQGSVQGSVFPRILNPQNAMSCTTYAAFGSPRVVVSCCKTISRSAVTAEVASSSLVFPAILSNHLQVLVDPFVEQRLNIGEPGNRVVHRFSDVWEHFGGFHVVAIGNL